MTPDNLSGMGRKRQQRTDAAEDPRADEHPFAFIPDEHGGVTVMRDGHPQSHVNLDDPTALEFEYVQHFALVLETLTPATSLAVTHVGGAGLTFARYVEHRRPGSPQIVLEPDAALTEAVRRELPLPRQHRIRVRAQDGATGIHGLKDASAEMVIVDAFADGRVPAELVSPAFVNDLARVLTPSGILMVNLADEPGLAWAARAIATYQSVFSHGVLVAAQEVLKGRRFGNVVLAVSRDAAAIDVDAVRRGAARAMFPTGVRYGGDLTRLTASVRPFTDADAERSPAPPELGAWRIR